ncbi:MAG: hypothetical protein IPG57_18780 [Burkholderiales bacterium]|nr:hypothetical protein [Burkholderiales bacterium]
MLYSIGTDGSLIRDAQRFPAWSPPPRLWMQRCVSSSTGGGSRSRAWPAS